MMAKEIDSLLHTADPDRYLCALFAQPDDRAGLLALYGLNHELGKAADSSSESLIGEMKHLSRMIIFAKSSEETAGGSFTSVRFAGVNPDAVNDGQGPQMDVYLNDPSFFNGSLMNSSPKWG
mgnify:CR=1 FL=1